MDRNDKVKIKKTAAISIGANPDDTFIVVDKVRECPLRPFKYTVKSLSTGNQYEPVLELEMEKLTQ